MSQRAKPPPLDLQEVTPTKFLEFEKWLLEQARDAIQGTKLPKYCPNSQWVVTIENATVTVRMRREDITLNAVNAA